MTASSFEQEQKHEHRLMDRVLDADRSLWASLLTVNGLILASAVFLASPSHWDQFVLLILICSVSFVGFEIVMNFRFLKVHAMGKERSWSKRFGFGQKKNIARKEMDRYPTITELREITALWCTGIEMLILGLMIVVE